MKKTATLQLDDRQLAALKAVRAKGEAQAEQPDPELSEILAGLADSILAAFAEAIIEQTEMSIETQHRSRGRSM